ncbi:MAG: alpha/beta fold hydrolase [Colwellia sp.]|nr:alpha/beta fold hydrolase [Colwellia sp.]MCW8865810.1 alpha/beta fold hydrolase [Colwellia sp.]MCW9081792.1 alpha/beta fold hydrolase [Colwellia sp.]
MTIADDFTTEKQLAKDYTGKINTFWQQGSFSSFTGVNNTRINYATFIQKEAAPSQENKCLVIVSGRSESYLKYQELSFDLFARGYSVFLIDHRGQGLSERALNNPHKGYVEDFQYYVDDLAYFIENIVSQHCQRKPYILAHSMGGAIAARYLQDFPDSIQAAVLSSPMLGFNGGGVPEFIAQSVIKTTAQLNQWLDDSPWYFIGHKDFAHTGFANNPLMHSAVRYQIFTELYQNTPAIQLGGVTTKWLTESLAALEKLFANIDSISTPTLVLQAGDDKIVSNQAQNDFCQQLHSLHPQSCPDGKPTVIAGAYHELFFERDIYRNQALTAVINWFEQHSSTNLAQAD